MLLMNQYNTGIFSCFLLLLSCFFFHLSSDPMIFFCVSDIVTRNVASGGTDPPPEPNGAAPSSTCARHGTVFGTAPGVSVQLTPNCLPSTGLSPGCGTLSAKPALEPYISSLEHQAPGTRSLDLVLQTRWQVLQHAR